VEVISMTRQQGLSANRVNRAYRPVCQPKGWRVDRARWVDVGLPTLAY